MARETLQEIGHLVGVLREDGSAGSRDEVEPPTGLSALGALAESHGRAGVPVAVRINGSSRQPAPGVDRAAYRIVQEALTNAARHGGGSATVEATYGPRALEITVTSPMPRDGVPASPSGGHGIVGMRERAALVGGSLEAGAGDGLFRVRARLPYGGEDGR